MKPEQRRIAIAKACGWKFTLINERYIGGPVWEIESPSGEVNDSWSQYYYTNQNRTGVEEKRHLFRELTDIVLDKAKIPDYLNDLNAIHEAEQIVLKLEHRDEYWWSLQTITQKNRMATTYWTNLTSTAAQRAEALIKTLNLQITEGHD